MFDPYAYGDEIAAILALDGNGERLMPLAGGTCSSEEARRLSTCSTGAPGRSSPSLQQRRQSQQHFVACPLAERILGKQRFVDPHALQLAFEGSQFAQQREDGGQVPQRGGAHDNVTHIHLDIPCGVRGKAMVCHTWVS